VAIKKYRWVKKTRMSPFSLKAKENPFSLREKARMRGYKIKQFFCFIPFYARRLIGYSQPSPSGRGS
jgi:hypothetical protein